MTAQNGQKTAARLLLKVEAKLTVLDAASFTDSGLTASEIHAAPTTMPAETEKITTPVIRNPSYTICCSPPLIFAEVRTKVWITV